MGTSHSHLRDVSKETLKKKAISVECEPDFGWRELLDCGRSYNSNSSLPEYGNELTGMTLQISLVDLALNVGIRAVHLAKSFGIPVDEMSDDSIYSYLGVPNGGWRLLDTNYVYKSTKMLSCCFQSKNNHERFDSSSAYFKPFSKSVSRFIYQKNTYSCNVGVTGLMLHEQLLRIEKKKSINIVHSNQKEYPHDTFGWTKISGSPNSNKEYEIMDCYHTKFYIQPHEFILNTMQWVLDTYCTQTIDIGIFNTFSFSNCNNNYLNCNNNEENSNIDKKLPRIGGETISTNIKNMRNKNYK